MKSNKYLGAIIGLAGIGAVIYALTRKYAGTYTTIFAVISGIIAILYIAINLWNFQSK